MIMIKISNMKIIDMKIIIVIIRDKARERKASQIITFTVRTLKIST